MRVCIDATPLLLRSAGVKTYFFHWLRHLAGIESDIAIDVFPHLPGTGMLDHEGSHYSLAATWWRLSLLLAANRGFPLAQRALMPRHTSLFHVSNQVRRPPRNVALSATVHDFTCWLMPELHTAANVQADRSFADRVLKRATGLIAVSENTRRDAIRVLGVDGARVKVIYPGVSVAYFRAAVLSRGAASEAKSHQTARQNTKPYVLFVGTIEPRKNVGLLMDAFSMMPASIREQYDLKIAGPPGWGADDLMRRLAAPPAGVHYLGYVPEERAPALFAGATLLAYPSLYEGFGFPVAQSLASGVPVLTSAVSSLPEVAGPGGRMVDPRSVSEIRDGLVEMLTSPSKRETLARLGAAHAERLFQWEGNARQSIAFFQEIGQRLGSR